MTGEKPGADVGAADKAGGAGGAGDFAGMGSCDEPMVVWQRFYQREWQQVKAKYYDPAALKDFDQYEHKFDAHICSPADMDIAISRMAGSLHDHWTRYESPADREAKEEQKRNGLVPAGFELAADGPGKFKIEFIHYGSPAQKSDLREGDQVTAIDGKPLSGLSLSEARALQMKQNGSAMEVEAMHDGASEMVSLPVAATPAEQIESRMLTQDVAYVRLPDFGSEARIEKFVQNLSDLAKANPHLKGLVLDLRNNSGGEWPAAEEVASLFLPDEKMKIATRLTRSNDPADPQGMRQRDVHVTPAADLKVNRNPVDPALIEKLRQLPMTVLVNGSTASAAEVVTGALKDNDRATVIGAQTFGKGVGYNHDGLPTGGVLAITDMKYLTPSGYDLNGRGISPNQPVEARPGDSDDAQLAAALSFLQKKIKDLH